MSSQQISAHLTRMLGFTLGGLRLTKGDEGVFCPQYSEIQFADCNKTRWSIFSCATCC